METTFHFVDGRQTDRLAKRRMRSHVMKGKNAGKKIHRRSRLALTNPRQHALVRKDCHGLLNDIEIEERRKRVSDAVSTTMRWDGLLSPVSFRLNPSTWETIHQFYIYITERIYPITLGLSFRDATSMLLPFTFETEPVYHCSMALMQASNQLFLDHGESTPMALHYLSRAFILVTRLLQGDQALSDAAIMIVVTLINQEQIRKDQKTVKVHFEGLKKIINLRGGISKLEHRTPLLLKVCKTDTTLALQLGETPAFFRDHMDEVRDILATKGYPLDRASAAASLRHQQMDPFLHDILVDVLSISALFNNNLPGMQMEMHIFQEMKVSVCYRLLQLHPLDDRGSKSPLEATYQLGLTVFVMTIYLQRGHLQALDYSLISPRLSSVLGGDILEQYPVVALWLALMGAIWIGHDEQEQWIITKIDKISRSVGIKSWEEARDAIGVCPWIDVLHGAPGRQMWQSSQSL